MRTLWYDGCGLRGKEREEVGLWRSADLWVEGKVDVCF